MITIDEMEWYHWIILIVPCVLILFSILWIVWLGRRPRMPEGKLCTKKRGKYKARVVSQYTDNHPDTTLKKIAEACALAIWSSGESWEREMSDKRDEDTDVLRDVCVYFVDDDYFEAQPYTLLQKAAAFLVNTGAYVGSGIPMAVVRVSLLGLVIEKGEPVIHEMMHAVLGEFTEPDKDRDHSNTQVWAANGGAVQIGARKLYQENKEILT